MDASDFILGCQKENIRSNVVVAPCWSPQSVGIKRCEPVNSQVTVNSQVSNIWNCMIDNKEFTYIVTGVGAALCLDIILALEGTPCCRALFLGSAGALKKGIQIGDFAVATGSVSADGATRYLGNSLSQDVFGKAYFSSFSLHEYLLKRLVGITADQEVRVHSGMGISVESVLLQYKHMDELLGFSCHFVDMESAAFFAACCSINLEAAAIFCISDNVAQDEPLYNVPQKKTAFRKKLRSIVIPECLREFLLWKQQ